LPEHGASDLRHNDASVLLQFQRVQDQTPEFGGGKAAHTEQLADDAGPCSGRHECGSGMERVGCDAGKAETAAVRDQSAEQAVGGVGCDGVALAREKVRHLLAAGGGVGLNDVHVGVPGVRDVVVELDHRHALQEGAHLGR